MRRFCLKFQTHHEIRDDRKGKRKAGRLAFGDFRPENREIFTKKNKNINKGNKFFARQPFLESERKSRPGGGLLESRPPSCYREWFICAPATDVDRIRLMNFNCFQHKAYTKPKKGLNIYWFKGEEGKSWKIIYLLW